MALPSPEGNPLFAAAERARLAALRAERQTAVRLVQAYGRAWQRVQGDVAALEAAMAELGAPTWAQVEQMTLYKAMIRQIEAEVGRYAVVAGDEVDAGARAAVDAALRDSTRLTQLALPGFDFAAVEGVFNKLNPDVVATMLGFLDDGAPLRKNLEKLGADVAATVAEKLKEGIILGYNPRKVARIIRDATGQGLTWSLNTARTSNLYAYRTAALANYRANSHVVSGWIWFCALDDRTCMSCVAMHGTFHTLDETLDDHHAGRCSMVPTTKSYEELGLPIPEEPRDVKSGEAWFNELPASQQAAMMGAAKYAAWRAGEFNFADLSTTYEDEVYGQMRREASLKDLIGERASGYYGRGARD